MPSCPLKSHVAELVCILETGHLVPGISIPLTQLDLAALVGRLGSLSVLSSLCKA